MSSIFGRSPYPLFILISWSCISFFVCVMVLRQSKRINSSCFIFFRVTGCGHTDFNQSIFNDWTRNQRQRGGNNKPLSLEKRHVKYLVSYSCSWSFGMIKSNTKFVTFKLEVIDCLYVITSCFNLPKNVCMRNTYKLSCDIQKKQKPTNQTA